MFFPGTIRHYRTTDEFDGFDDIELEHLIFQAKLRRDDAIWILPLVSVIALWIFVFGPIASLAFILARSVATPMATGNAPGSPSTLSVGELIAIVLVAVFGLLATIAAWIIIRRWLIIRSIRHIMSKASCPYCSFDLRGLPVAEQTLVRCPECGELIVLSDFGLSKRDLALDDGLGAPRQPVSAFQKQNIPPDRLVPTEQEKPRIQPSPSALRAGIKRPTPPPPKTDTPLM